MSLASCPHCDAVEVALVECPEGKATLFDGETDQLREVDATWFVACSVCGLETSLFPTQDEAKAAWSSGLLYTTPKSLA